MPKNSDIADLLANMPNKKCRRCGVETEFADFGDLSILCYDCEKIEAKEESSKELADFDRNPFCYDIDEILRDREYYEVLSQFAESIEIPDQRLLACEQIPTFIGRLSRDWRNGFFDMIAEGHHSILFQVLPSLTRCGATEAAEAVSECLAVLDRFGYRTLILESEEPYSELSESDRESLDSALRALESKWGTFVGIDREMQVSAHRWVIEHKEDFAPRKPKA
ncbi:hypothetical protein [Cerasicoccus fimbriatus]|uniref:hypothetical protein n=1 Tax=Cerasicoccus fimbriatus TaxID=3014554 RepID=UPI0022B2B5C7|nr:hypothetical protein [Cerasicoccus sp. TK19100]